MHRHPQCLRRTQVCASRCSVSHTQTDIHSSTTGISVRRSAGTKSVGRTCPESDADATIMDPAAAASGWRLQPRCLWRNARWIFANSTGTALYPHGILHENILMLDLYRALLQIPRPTNRSSKMSLHRRRRNQPPLSQHRTNTVPKIGYSRVNTAHNRMSGTQHKGNRADMFSQAATRAIARHNRPTVMPLLHLHHRLRAGHTFHLRKRRKLEGARNQHTVLTRQEHTRRQPLRLANILIPPSSVQTNRTLSTSLLRSPAKVSNRTYPRIQTRYLACTSPHLPIYPLGNKLRMRLYKEERSLNTLSRHLTLVHTVTTNRQLFQARLRGIMRNKLCTRGSNMGNISTLQLGRLSSQARMDSLCRISTSKGKRISRANTEKMPKRSNNTTTKQHNRVNIMRRRLRTNSLPTTTPPSRRPTSNSKRASGNQLRWPVKVTRSSRLVYKLRTAHSNRHGNQTIRLNSQARKDMARGQRRRSLSTDIRALPLQDSLTTLVRRVSRYHRYRIK